jgi:hypothetical protein
MLPACRFLCFTGPTARQSIPNLTGRLPIGGERLRCKIIAGLRFLSILPYIALP